MSYNRSGTSGDGTGSDARSGGKKADKTPKVDYSDPKNNVSIKFLKRHKAKGPHPFICFVYIMLNLINYFFLVKQWRSYTLKNLIENQDCAVDAVKLEWLLRNDKSVKTRRK